MIPPPRGYRERERELRCELCNYRPLIATYGITLAGNLYVHIFVRKGPKVYGNIYCEGNTLVQCRDCLRWHRVSIPSPGRAVLVEEV